MEKNQEIEYSDDFLIIRQKPLILKLRSLGAGVEDEEETKITYLEAAYFADRKVLPLDKEELLKRAGKKDKMAAEKYATIKYLRDRGYIVRPSLDGTPYLRLHRKGYRPGEDKTYYLIHVVKSDWKASSESLVEPLEAASRLRKELAIAIVDANTGEPKFLKFARLNFE
jgi:tRNA splicing endonuclease